MCNHKLLKSPHAFCIIVFSAIGFWGSWQRVGTCSKTSCGPGQQKRIRACNDPGSTIFQPNRTGVEYRGTCVGPTSDCVVGCPSKKYAIVLYILLKFSFLNIYIYMASFMFSFMCNTYFNLVLRWWVPYHWWHCGKQALHLSIPIHKSIWYDSCVYKLY